MEEGGRGCDVDGLCLYGTLAHNAWLFQAPTSDAGKSIHRLGNHDIHYEVQSAAALMNYMISSLTADFFQTSGFTLAFVNLRLLDV
jgi:hypothetical protein